MARCINEIKSHAINVFADVLAYANLFDRLLPSWLLFYIAYHLKFYILTSILLDELYIHIYAALIYVLVRLLFYFV